MKQAAVMIDKWKLPIFSRHLREAGFKYDTGAGVTAKTIMLKVFYDTIAGLQPIIEAAQKECHATGKPK